MSYPIADLTAAHKRADAAEATIARVTALRDDARGSGARVGEGFYPFIMVDELTAALDGDPLENDE